MPWLPDPWLDRSFSFGLEGGTEVARPPAAAAEAAGLPPVVVPPLGGLLVRQYGESCFHAEVTYQELPSLGLLISACDGDMPPTFPSDKTPQP